MARWTVRQGVAGSELAEHQGVDGEVDVADVDGGGPDGPTVEVDQDPAGVVGVVVDDQAVAAAGGDDRLALDLGVEVPAAERGVKGAEVRGPPARLHRASTFPG